MFRDSFTFDDSLKMTQRGVVARLEASMRRCVGEGMTAMQGKFAKKEDIHSTLLFSGTQSTYFETILYNIAQRKAHL